jgi:hypothetical protein
VYCPGEDINTKFATDLVMHVMLLHFMLGSFPHATWADVVRCPVGCKEFWERMPLLPCLNARGVPGPFPQGNGTVRDVVAVLYLAAGYPGCTPHGACARMSTSSRRPPCVPRLPGM